MLDELYLIVPELGTQDEIGVFRKSGPENRRRVLCEAGGIRRSEWAAAGSAGHRPELVVTVPFVDYRGETEADYRKQRYSIYRTYPVNDGWDIELYLEIKDGVRG